MSSNGKERSRDDLGGDITRRIPKKSKGSSTTVKNHVLQNIDESSTSSTAAAVMDSSIDVINSHTSDIMDDLDPVAQARKALEMFQEVSGEIVIQNYSSSSPAVKEDHEEKKKMPAVELSNFINNNTNNNNSKNNKRQRQRNRIEQQHQQQLSWSTTTNGHSNNDNKNSILDHPKTEETALKPSPKTKEEIEEEKQKREEEEIKRKKRTEGGMAIRRAFKPKIATPHDVLL
jgi:hypothetical protein